MSAVLHISTFVQSVATAEIPALAATLLPAALLVSAILVAAVVEVVSPHTSSVVHTCWKQLDEEELEEEPKSLELLKPGLLELELL